MANTYPDGVGGGDDDDSPDYSENDSEGTTREDLRRVLGGSVTATAVTGVLVDIFGVDGLAALRAFAKDPTAGILSVVFGWVVNRVLVFGEWVIAQILIIGIGIGRGIGAIGRAVGTPLALAFDGGAAGIVATHQLVVEFVTGFGIGALPASILVIAAEVFVLLWLVDLAIRVGLISLLGSIPVIGALANILGQAYIASKSAFARLKEVVLG